MEPVKPRFRIHPLSIVAAIVIAGLLLGLAYLLLRLAGGTPSAPTTVTPTYAVTKIPAPTSTPPTIVPTLIATPTPEVPVLLPTGVMGVGEYVKVTGTEGLGLRLRDGAGTASNVKFLSFDEEIFGIVGGPIVSDGYTWWQLEAPYDATRAGWAAENFLELIDIETPVP